MDRIVELLYCTPESNRTLYVILEFKINRKEGRKERERRREERRGEERNQHMTRSTQFKPVLFKRVNWGRLGGSVS